MAIFTIEQVLLYNISIFSAPNVQHWWKRGMHVRSPVHTTKLAQARPRLGLGLCCVHITWTEQLSRAQATAVELLFLPLLYNFCLCACAIADQTGARTKFLSTLTTQHTNLGSAQAEPKSTAGPSWPRPSLGFSRPHQHGPGLSCQKLGPSLGQFVQCGQGQSCLLTTFHIALYITLIQSREAKREKKLQLLLQNCKHNSQII